MNLKTESASWSSIDVFDFSAIFELEVRGMDKKEGCSAILPDKHFGQLLLFSIIITTLVILDSRFHFAYSAGLVGWLPSKLGFYNSLLHAVFYVTACNRSFILIVVAPFKMGLCYFHFFSQYCHSYVHDHSASCYKMHNTGLLLTGIIRCQLAQIFISRK
jgi:hypothetical protein